jgi:hypothetical protein
MLSRCCEFVDSRLRRSPPDRASAVPYGQAGENAMRFPHLAHRSAAAHKLHSTPQQDGMNVISGKGETSSRLPVFSLSSPEAVQTTGTVAVFPNVEAVDLMVASCVIEELDLNKTSTKRRRRDRARAALHLVEKASREPDLALVLTTGAVALRWTTSARCSRTSRTCSSTIQLPFIGLTARQFGRGTAPCNVKTSGRCANFTIVFLC